jgi:beta-galactosidase
MIWMWQDQGLRVNGRMLLNPDGQDGIVRADRTPQRDYWETKAVYAPVSIPIDRIEWKRGLECLRVPVRNDYDFLDLSTVRIQWRLMADERELASGEVRAGALPHATEWVEIPAAKIPAVSADAACYLHFVFQHADGSAITRRSVEILRPTIPVASQASVRVAVRKARTVTITAGSTVYEFDPQSARLISVVSGGKRVAEDMRLTLWRPLDQWEVLGYKRYGTDGSKYPDLNQYTTTVREWKVTADRHSVCVTAKAEHRVGAQDSFEAEYRYAARAEDGALDVEYSVRPRIQVPWIPEIGMELRTASKTDTLRWLGLGPMESAPNMKAATIFGLWSLPVDSERAQGLRSDVRWAEIGDLRFENCGYLRLADAGRVRILSAVEGRGAKYRRAEKPEDRLDVNPQRTLVGSFRLRVVAR